MRDEEIVYMVVILTLMSDMHFRECVKYVEKQNMYSGEREFMEHVLAVAYKKRIKLSKGGAV